MTSERERPVAIGMLILAPTKVMPTNTKVPSSSPADGGISVGEGERASAGLDRVILHAIRGCKHSEFGEVSSECDICGVVIGPDRVSCSPKVSSVFTGEKIEGSETRRRSRVWDSREGSTLDGCRCRCL